MPDNAIIERAWGTYPAHECESQSNLGTSDFNFAIHDDNQSIILFIDFLWQFCYFSKNKKKRNGERSSKFKTQDLLLSIQILHLTNINTNCFFNTCHSSY